MKYFAYVISMVLFVGGIFLFGYAFSVPSIEAILFFLGIIAVSLSLYLPFHVHKLGDR
ncbi:MAG: hypothetical protein ABWX66_01085 [Lacisediminihabitans sp.]